MKHFYSLYTVKKNYLESESSVVPTKSEAASLPDSGNYFIQGFFHCILLITKIYLQSLSVSDNINFLKKLST